MQKLTRTIDCRFLEIGKFHQQVNICEVKAPVKQEIDPPTRMTMLTLDSPLRKRRCAK